MKKAYLLICASMVFSGVCLGLTIPKGTDKQLAVSPLENGELAWTEIANGAELYIGNGAGNLRVTDSAALRGRRTYVLDPSEYAISADATFSYNPVTRTYTHSASTTNNIIVSIPSIYRVSKVNVTAKATPVPGSLMGDSPYVHKKEEGNITIFEVNKGKGNSQVQLSDFQVYIITDGDGDGFNDLTLTTYMLRDRLGTIDFSELRYWAKHLYDGNRGEHWANYPATNKVLFAGQPMFLGRSGVNADAIIKLDSKTNFVIQAGFYEPIKIEQLHPPSPNYTYFRITDIEVKSSGDDVIIEYTHDIQGFDVNNLAVWVCDGLEPPALWYTLSKSDYSATSTTVTIPGDRANLSRRFYKLLYLNIATEAIQVNFRGRVVVHDMLILKGEDSKYYKITVNNGNISATEISL